MIHIKVPIIIDGSKCQLDIDTSCYAKESIAATAYKFTDRYYVYQRQVNSSTICVVFESKDNKAVGEEIAKCFCNELIDQQVRYDTNKQFGHIRNMIVEQAFKPVEAKDDKDKEEK